jgi:hypothetical protein
MGFGCLMLVAVTYRSDRLGTIDLPCRRRASGGVLLVSALWCWSRGLIAPIDWGQSIYHADDAQRRRLTGFGCLMLVAVAYRADRLGTIDLPFDQACRIAMGVDLPWYPG